MAIEVAGIGLTRLRIDAAVARHKDKLIGQDRARGAGAGQGGRPFEVLRLGPFRGDRCIGADARPVRASEP
jgi:hypothetical protein